ncbi:MAG: bifunctional 2-polyprenyl-6-hydroxyphenol methylase/3-demethylubiquinol 3-O-methyltransferase UbiG [Flavobacteriaceae bacterium]|jgi:2-polyprenyl-6-hydroxyphenyl methylase/3-demethylubiquinone-9 3-methyltransferase|nr:bifunctional 2-polyprenyl-6-hydroxyphenol methylase/3-demethylubiquinol 3-O-methyltransferase UbiG [Pelagibacteraceae bacterium]MBT4644934.1 bifunctional 2-polyprenyl-6-hydroxyphenol methylase/3-demethylubiquinol 3-O-methyltransferase UbiG [Pelagibacteraceae bacterium]MBT4959382.1 bifunctional 2-polyprenyl-6-hydroxyphenol methylase/3-demethylubiquinol 3-O-methyltransferase UbiG [Flavobacteriaceae bacterium]MBT6354132.1 bifunctional 2-polyprenyl-6-hydroxyphenol methylase/3-demethylubiquinol 3-
MEIKSKKSEFNHFSKLATEWWNKNGIFKILHDIQLIRIKYIQDTLNKKKLNKLKILDLGCGGGLVSEGIAKLGADVTGIDFIEENIRVAKKHAKQSKLEINYIVKDFEKERLTSKYDVIIIFEVLEHLENWKSFLEKIQKNLKPKGVLIASTINRNLISKFLTIDLAENLLKWIPLNTHNYYKFIKPEELKDNLTANNFKKIEFSGLSYNIFKQKWKMNNNKKVNYFCSSFLN